VVGELRAAVLVGRWEVAASPTYANW